MLFSQRFKSSVVLKQLKLTVLSKWDVKLVTFIQRSFGNPDPYNPDPDNPDPDNPGPDNPDPANPDPFNPDPRVVRTV